MDFSVKVGEIKAVLSDVASVDEAVKQAKAELNSIISSRGLSSVSYRAIHQSLHRTESKLNEMIHTFAQMEDGLEKAVEYYLSCENAISDTYVADTSPRAAQTNSEENKSILQWLQDLFAGWGWGDSDKAKEVRNDNAMAEQIKKQLKQKKYSKETWKKSTVGQREQILRNLFAEINTIMGIKVTDFFVENIESEEGYITYGYLSYYSPDYMSVTVNRGLLSDEKYYDKIMDTMAHEMRHGYQHSVVDHPEQYEVDEDTIEKWRDNFNDYKTTEDDGYDEYRNQSVEKDARGFAGKVI